MSLTPLQARDEMCDLVETAWDAAAATTGKPIEFPQVKINTPRDGEAWARVTIQGVTGRATAIGGVRYRQIGVITVQCFGAHDDGGDEVHAIANVILQALSGTRTDGGVFFWNPRIINLADEKNWSRINVIADYRYIQANP